MKKSDESTTTISDIQDILRADVIAGDDQLDTPVDAGICSDLMSDIMWGPTEGAVLLTGLNNVQAVRSCVISGVVGMVLVRGKEPAEELVKQAKAYNFPLLCTPFYMYSACGRLFSRGLRGVDGKKSRPEPHAGKETS